jgi:two-component system phosphate regulon sensor histidine kinase PhoR
MEILETLHDPLILVNPAQRVVRANAAARSLFGRSLEEEPIETALYPPELLNAVRESLERHDIVTLAIDWPGFFVRHFDVRVLPIGTMPDHGFGEEAEVMPPAIAAVITLHETTELRRAAELRERFIANVSHELRTPLSSIIGFIETLQGPARTDAEAQTRFLQIMRDQAARMNRLVADLLSLARIEEKENEPPADSVDIGEVLRDVADALDLRARERNMRIELALPETLPMILGDGDQLFQVFQNLTDNAIKYGTAGTPIRLAVETGEHSLTISVEDHGEGIAPEHLPHLGERFYRVDRARSRATGGSGLGLALVRRIVARHRGRFEVESTPGKGSVFRIDLPLSAGMNKR